MDNESFHRLVRAAAHDVRTPITTIGGFAELLADDKTLSASAQDMAATIVEETRRLAEMLDEFFEEISPKAEGLQ